jgi:hypothetical protein
MEKEPWIRRLEELLSKLSARAASCPGLYPIRARGDFVRIVADHLDEALAGDAEPAWDALPQGRLEEFCHWLEKVFHQPELSHQLHAQSLIRRGVTLASLHGLGDGAGLSQAG